LRKARIALLALGALGAACNKSHGSGAESAPSASETASAPVASAAPAAKAADAGPCADCGPTVIAACGHDVRISESTLAHDPDLDAGTTPAFITASWVAVARFAEISIEAGASDADARRAYCVRQGADACAKPAPWELDGPKDRGHAPVTYVAPIAGGLLVATGGLKGGDCAIDGSFYGSEATLAAGVLVVHSKVDALEQPGCTKRVRGYASSTFYDPKSGHVVTVQGAKASLQGRVIVAPGCPRVDLDAPLPRR
jgi:hypothetical protein